MKLKNVNIFFLMFVVGSTFLGAFFQRSYAEENGVEVNKKIEQITINRQNRDERNGSFPREKTKQEKDMIETIGARAQKLRFKTVVVEGWAPIFFQGHSFPWVSDPEGTVPGGRLLIRGV